MLDCLAAISRLQCVYPYSVSLTLIVAFVADYSTCYHMGQRTVGTSVKMKNEYEMCENYNGEVQLEAKRKTWLPDLDSNQQPSC